MEITAWVFRYSQQLNIHWGIVVNLQKLNPWNWYKHEDGKALSGSHIPVNRTTALNRMTSSDADKYHPVMQIHREFDAKLGDGVLKLTIPRRQPAAKQDVKQIPIN
jgi:hypothetical protein